MLWASFYWFKNGISYTMNLVRFAPACFRVPVSEVRPPGSGIRKNADTGIPENRKLACARAMAGRWRAGTRGLTSCYGPGH
jgi:hypothetical protein